MATVAEIQEAIRGLSPEEYRQFMPWFAEHDWERWDQEIEEDSADSKLDHLAGQAEMAKRRGMPPSANSLEA